jgi:hypothetical protein
MNVRVTKSTVIHRAATLLNKKSSGLSLYRSTGRTPQNALRA